MSSPRLETNAIHLPSGLTVGWVSLALSLVSWRAAAAGQRYQPQIGEALVLRDVVGGDRHHGELAVGRDGRIAEPLERPHALGGELA